MKMMTSTMTMLLFGVAISAWTEPLKVASRYKYYHYPKVFTDQQSGISHIIWKDLVSKNLLKYRQISSNNKLSEVTSFEFAQEVEYIQIGGYNDGKYLFIIFSGKREKGVEECTQDTPKGCSDVWFMKSEDAGKTWSNALAIPRPDMNDVRNRERPQYLVSLNKNIWIFFFSYGEDRKLSGRYVSKLRDSIVFSQEKKLPIVLSYFFNYMEIVESKETLVLYYCETQDFFRIYSNNSGVDWIGPEPINSFCKGEYLETFPFASEMAPYHLFVLCEDKEFKRSFKTSTDFGKVWVQSDDIKSIYQRVCSISGNYMEKNVWFSYINYDDDEISTLYTANLNVPLKEISWTEIKVPTEHDHKPVALTSLNDPKVIYYWYEVSYTSSLYMMKYSGLE